MIREVDDIVKMDVKQIRDAALQYHDQYGEDIPLKSMEKLISMILSIADFERLSDKVSTDIDIVHVIEANSKWDRVGSVGNYVVLRRNRR
jgi:hypothetical protein